MSTPKATSFDGLIDIITQQADAVKAELTRISGLGENVGVGDMFKMQMAMNKLSQLSEMSGAVMSASNSSVMSLARNVKG